MPRGSGILASRGARTLGALLSGLRRIGVKFKIVCRLFEFLSSEAMGTGQMPAIGRILDDMHFPTCVHG